jgi:hypothetical protein
MSKKIFAFICVVAYSLLLCSCSFGNLEIVSKDATAAKESNVEVDTESEKEKTIEIVEPDLSQIRSICKLATVECYYHNVAKSEKKAGSGLSHLGENSRKFWIEYTGTAKLGVDMSRGSIDVDDTVVTVYMPEAEIINIKVDSDSIQNPIMDKDGWNKNPIDSEDVTGAMETAQTQIKEYIEKDSGLLISAEERAEKLIENYIDQLGEACGVEFTVKFEMVNNTSSDDNSEFE